jgi:hypothetical protein
VSSGLDRYFFVHVMKTAGGTFRRNLRENFAPDELYPARGVDEPKVAYWLIERLTALPAERRERIRMYTGHFPYVVSQLLGVELVTLTLLRDPVERTLSLLRQRQHLGEDNPGMALEAIYEDPMVFECFIHNHQAKIFAMTAEDRLESYMDAIDVDAQRLATAKDNLQQVDLFGFKEDFGEFREEAERRYGWNLPGGFHRHGVPEAADVAPSFRRRIADDNTTDMEFHEYARELYRQRRREWATP